VINSSELLNNQSSQFDLLFERNVRSHPAWNGRYPGGSRGFSEPLYEGGRVVTDLASATDELADAGIKVSGQPGLDSVLFLGSTFRSPGLVINMFGHENTAIFLGSSCSLRGQISIEGPNHSVVFSGSSRDFRINATMRGSGGVLFIGRDGSANSVDFLVEGPSVSLSVGDDTMISYDVAVTTSDSHGIISLGGGGALLNPPASIQIGPHVWLSAHVTVQKGRSVGRGAIVGGRSVVTRDVPPCTLVVGAPAEIKQINVTWTRESKPLSSQILAMCDQIHSEKGSW
jgi:acetyltransferase-like isoleucine patch superfamily enzyme